MTQGHQRFSGHHSPIWYWLCSSDVHCDEGYKFKKGWSEPAGMRRATRVFQGKGLALMPLSHPGY